MTAHEIISSKNNQYVKLARSLEQKKIRKQEGLFVAEGVRNIREVLNGGCKPVFALVDCEKATEMAELIDGLAEIGCKMIFVLPEIMHHAAQTEESQGLLLVLRQPQMDAERFAEACKGKAVAVLDCVRDPGNVGTILRTAWAAGLGGVILTSGSVDVYSPKVVRSAMGALYHVAVWQTDEQSAAEFLEGSAYQILAADLDGVNFREFRPDAGKKPAWVMGSEADGVSDFWLSRATAITIPMAPGVESLNVGIAAGILFFSVDNL